MRNTQAFISSGGRPTLLVFLISLLAIFPATHSARAAAPSVLTQHNDNARTGANLNETVLNTANVNVNSFGKLFARPVDGSIYAQPLYMPAVSITGKGVHNVVFVATDHNWIYAFDADDPAQSAPLWKVSLGPYRPRGFSTIYGYFGVNIGIIGTPVIDPATRTLYVVACTKDSGTGTIRYKLHALYIGNGTEVFGGPVEIQGSVSGHGDGAMGGIVEFAPSMHLQRPALLLSVGVVYVAFGSLYDTPPSHGWLFGYSAATLTRQSVFNTTPDGTVGTLWMAGQGPTADEAGNVYVMSANGTSDGTTNYGQSFLKLSKDLSLLDWFTPNNFAALNAIDNDLGSSGVLCLPGSTRVVGGGKEGKLYLIDTGSLGHFASGQDNVVQSFYACIGHIHGGPIYWNSPSFGPVIYVWSEQDRLRAYKYAGGLLQTPPVSMSSMALPSGMPGGILSLSANGSMAGTGIVWASSRCFSDTSPDYVRGMLHAFDATDLSKELWNSRMMLGRDDSGLFANFCPPTIAAGKVYLATFSNQLVVYGPITASAPPSTPDGLAAAPCDSLVSLSWNAGANDVSYRISRSAALDGPYTVIVTNVTATSYIDSGLINGTTYYYKVAGLNSRGASADAGPVSATPMATTGAGTGSLLREYWLNVNGTETASIPLVLPATGYDYPTSFEGPTNWGEFFGERLSGYVTPPISGDYVFWIASDDTSKLYLSPDANPARAVQIASVTAFTGPRDFDKYTEQRSSPIALTAGRKYYIEALHKQSGLGEHVSVAWQGPGICMPRTVIAGRFLSPAAPGGAQYNENANIVLRNLSSRKIAVWFIVESRVVRSLHVNMALPTGWDVAGEADFDADGHPDLILQDAATRRIAIWYLDRSASYLRGAYVSATPPAGWRVAAVADFSGDGKPDIVLQNGDTGQCALWPVVDGVVTGGQYLAVLPPAGWQVVCSGDFNRDGKNDLVLQNAGTRQITVWYMNGATRLGGSVVGVIPPANWVAVGASDYDGDGKVDLVLQNAATGAAAIWTMYNTKLLAGLYMAPAPPAGWKALGPN